MRRTTLLIPYVAALCAISISALFAQSAAPAPVKFRNVAVSAGINFVLENHPTPKKHLIETMAGGLAAFDYDGDGLTDIFFTNGASIPSLEKDSPKYRNRLYRNLGNMKFKDVTDQAGVAGAGYSIGAAAADYDNDGHTDLFVGGVRRHFLYRNRGDGTFEDVTRKAGIKSEWWSEGAAWLDYDNDGKLDLFVVNYLQWTASFDLFCGDPASKVRAYCHPRFFEGTPNTLYRNRGDGTFEDVSQKSGIAAHIGKGMSASIADYDRDGFMDVFVTNDKIPNFLFHNKGDGTFEEVALLAGGALSDNGAPVSAMGTDFRDYDNDGFPDITYAALAGEVFPIFQNRGNGTFRDASFASRMGPLSHNRSGWSIGLVDLNNDGWKDIFTTNSHVNDTVEMFEATPYKLPNSFFLNRGDGTFVDGSRDAGPDFQTPAAHRGCGFADFNNDGRIDVVVASLQSPAELWENVSSADNSWLILKLTGTKSNRDSIGAVVRIGKQFNHMTSAVGYVSSSHFGVHFGTGQMKRIDEIEIIWPSGVHQTVKDVGVNQVLKVVESDR
ncbi:MAG TPA: CRTAC1 family protein [Bryobacteraceae bacterium]|nr:CRTAC1 family protein [Bryobacteraceae bacterium]